MSRVFLSIIIPAYNAEKYVDRCLSSIIPVLSEDIEIIVVNDGSKDATEEKILRYTEQFSQIKLISQVNQGVSSARNEGIKISTGEYIMFIDIDDHIIPHSFLEILKIVKQKEYSTYIFSHIEGNQDIGFKKVEQGFYEQDIKELYQETCRQKLNEPWKKIYSGTTIRQNNLKFPENLFIGEDIYFFLEYLQFSDDYLYINLPFYIYEKNSDSASTNIREEFIEQGYLVYSAIKKFIIDKQLNEERKINEIVFMHIVSRNIQSLMNVKHKKKSITGMLKSSGVYYELEEIEFEHKTDKVRKALIILGMYRTLTMILNLKKGN